MISPGTSAGGVTLSKPRIEAVSRRVASGYGNPVTALDEDAGLSNIRQITGNVGLFHVARELSREGWNVMLTSRNTRGADLYACSEDERTIHSIQVKTHSGKPLDTHLGLHPERFVTPWWIIVVYAHTPSQTACYLLKLDEIRQVMGRDPGTRSGKPEHERACWLNKRFYSPGSDGEMTAFKNAWDRLGSPGRE